MSVDFDISFLLVDWNDTVYLETLKKVRAFVESDPDILNDKSFYIMGFGWDHTRWANGDRWPTSVRNN